MASTSKNTKLAGLLAQLVVAVPFNVNGIAYRTGDTPEAKDVEKWAPGAVSARIANGYLATKAVADFEAARAGVLDFADDAPDVPPNSSTDVHSLRTETTMKDVPLPLELPQELLDGTDKGALRDFAKKNDLNVEIDVRKSLAEVRNVIIAAVQVHNDKLAEARGADGAE